MAGCDRNPIGGFISAGPIVEEQFDFFTDLVEQYILKANEFSQVLEDFTVEPVNLPPLNFDPASKFVPFEEPEEPEGFEPPDPQFTGSMPAAPDIDNIDTSGLDALHPPTEAAPAPPLFYIPPPPTVNLPPHPGPAPAMSDVEIPVYEAGPLPEPPTLYSLNLPEPPVIDFDLLEVTRPDFIPPDALQDMYWQDLVSFQDYLWTTIDQRVGDTGVYDMHDRLQQMLAGGTGLPFNIEQALFDRAIMREDKSSQQAMAQMESEWAAKGFSLPGSTLLARAQEMRQTNRMERGRINRELSIQFHTQEIENLRFAVEKAISLEGILLEAHTRILDLARQLADGHWVVAKGIYDSQLDTFRLYLEIYKSDLEANKLLIEIELAKLEVYKTELEAQKLIGDINQQMVMIYKTEVDAYLAGVEVYKAQVQAAEAQIHAELARIEGYKAEIDAYSATLGAEKIKFDIYNTTVNAELVKAQVYTAQVDAYGKRIDAYRSAVAGEAAKIDAHTSVMNAEISAYGVQVNAWAEGIKADSANLLAHVEVYKAELSKYTALLSKEQYRVEGESRNFALDLEKERARVEGLLKQADQAIEQMKHISSMGLAATDTAAKVNSQLAASAMSALNVSAGISSSNSVGATDSRSCTTNYSGII